MCAQLTGKQVSKKISSHLVSPRKNALTGFASGRTLFCLPLKGWLWKRDDVY